LPLDRRRHACNRENVKENAQSSRNRKASQVGATGRGGLRRPPPTPQSIARRASSRFWTRFTIIGPLKASYFTSLHAGAAVDRRVLSLLSEPHDIRPAVKALVDFLREARRDNPLKRLAALSPKANETTTFSRVCGGER
jgi:hypothetical protein